jgi:hypothetical protein
VLVRVGELQALERKTVRFASLWSRCGALFFYADDPPFYRPEGHRYRGTKGVEIEREKIGVVSVLVRSA